MTAPLTWIGEFNPTWTRDMPYPMTGATFRPTQAGQQALRRPRKFRFNTSATTPGRVQPWWYTSCPRRICLNVTFYSDFGALTDLEAFVLDRIESKSELATNAFDPHGPAPLIKGQISDDQLNLVFRNDSSKWYDFASGQPTNWMLYPRYDDEAHEIDATLSFKQLYTLLPGYNATVANLNNSGSLYSGDPNDQVIIRLTASRSGEFSTSSSMFPTVVNSTGSTLLDVEYTTSPSEGNIVSVNIAFKRRRFGAIPPWTPGRLSDQCNNRKAQLMASEIVAQCLGSEITEDLFRSMFDRTQGPNGFASKESLRNLGDRCFGKDFLARGGGRAPFWNRRLSEDSASESGSSGPGAGDVYEGVGGDTSASSWADDAGASAWDDDNEIGDPTERWYNALWVAKQANEALTGLIEGNCSFGDRSYANAAGQMIALQKYPSMVRVMAREPNFAFYLILEVANTIVNTPTISDADHPQRIEQFLQSAIPNASAYNFDISVRVENNLAMIAELERRNEWIRQRYHRGSDSSGSGHAFSSAGSGNEYSYGYNSAGSSYNSRDGSMDSSSSSDGNFVGSTPPPRYQGRFDSSGSFDFGGDVGSSSSESSWEGDDGRGYRQRQRRPDSTGRGLFNVPPPEFAVEIEFHNVSIVPQVLQVVKAPGSPIEISSTGSVGEVYLAVVPLQTESFTYAPPPPDLDLTWGGDNTSSNSTDDTCYECWGQMTDCVTDENCAFGLKTYLLDALDRLQMGYANVTSPVVNDFRINVTNVFRNAQPFFPANSFAKVSKLIGCLATRWPPCDLDYQRGQYNGMVAPPTRFTIRPAYGGFQTNLWSYTDFTQNGRWLKYYENGDSLAFDNFLANEVSNISTEEFWRLGGSSSSFNTSSMYGYGDQTVQHKGNMGNQLVDFPSSVYSNLADYYSSPWEVHIAADRPDGENLPDGGSTVQWQRLQNWVYQIRNYLGMSTTNWNSTTGGGMTTNQTDWNSTTGGWTTTNQPSWNSSTGTWTTTSQPTWNATTNGTATNQTNWNTTTGTNNVTLPANAASICPQCRNQLYACMINYECWRGVRRVVLPDLASAVRSARVPTNPYEGARVDISGNWTKWEANFPSEEAFMTFYELAACVTREYCALGYSSNFWEVQMPTTLSFSTWISVAMRKPTLLTFSWNGNVTTMKPDGDSWRLSQFLNSFLHLNSWISTWYDYPGDGTSVMRANPNGPLYPLPQITAESGQTNISVTQSIWLSVWNGAPLALDSLFTWFNATDMLHGDDIDTSRFNSSDPCLGCVAELQNCMKDEQCHSAVVDQLIPNWLTPPNYAANSHVIGSSQYNWNYGFTYFSVDLMPAFNGMNITDKDSWLAFISVFRCLAKVSCDVNYMTDAVAAPATAHQPTYVGYLPSTVRIDLYMDTQIAVTFHDTRYVYTRNAANYDDGDAFREWLQSSGAVGDVPIDVDVWVSPDNYIIVNHITLNYYAGELPVFEYVVAGPGGQSTPGRLTATDWKVNLTSNDSWPVWPKLVDLLSFLNTTVPVAEDAFSCLPCQSLRDQCLNDYICTYVLTNYMVPMMQESLNNRFTDDSMHEFDFTTSLMTEVLGSTWSLDTKNLLFKLLRCAANEGATCISESSGRGTRGAIARLVVQDPVTNFTVRVDAMVNMQLPDGGLASFQYTGDVDALQSFVVTRLAGIAINMTRVRIEDNGFHTLRITYPNYPLFKTTYFWGVWSGDYSMTYSADDPQRFILKSEASAPFALGDSFAAWFDWLMNKHR